MAKRKLGRGLSHLLPGSIDLSVDSKFSRHPEYQELSLSEITPNPAQPRTHFKKKELEEMAKTLHTVGLIEPVIVRKIKSGYQLISGERRFRACKLAGFKKIPAIIKNLNDVQALELGIIENIQREDLNPIEEARAYQALIDQTGIKPSQLAEKVGRDRTTITNLLRLLRLPESILQFIESEKISAGHARPLLTLGDRKTMLQLANKIVLHNWTARQVEDAVVRLTEPASGARSSKRSKSMRHDPNIRSMENKLRKRLMAQVRLEHTKKGSGKIVIRYGNLADLDRILELFGIK